MITPETPAIQSQTTAGTRPSMHRLPGCSYRDLVPGCTSDEPRNITELPRCGAMQYPTGTVDVYRLRQGLRGETGVYEKYSLRRADRRAAASGVGMWPDP